MSEVATLSTARPRSVLMDLADRYQMEPAALEATLRATVFPKDGTREEFAAFLIVARDYNLNPILKQIYAYPKKGGGIQPIVSIDGWIKLMNEHPQFGGIEFQEILSDAKDLLGCTATIYRKDRERPTSVTEWLEECQRPTEPWKMKHRMLRHKALIQCARIAFGFAGIMEPDEAESMIDVTPPQRSTRPEPKTQTQPVATPERKTYLFLDANGEEMGWHTAGKWALFLESEFEHGDKDALIALFEHNEATLAEIEATGLDLSNVRRAYAALINRAEIDTTEPAAQPPEPDPFWSRDSYEIKPSKWTDYADNYIRQALTANEASLLGKLEVDNKAHLDQLALKLPEHRKRIAQASNAKRQQLMAD